MLQGKARGTDPGIYFGGWSLCQCAGTGTWAGENAGRFAGECQQKPIDVQQVKNLKKKVYAPLLSGGLRPLDVLSEVQKAVFPYDVLILKSESKVKQALSDVERIEHELIPHMGARDCRELMRLNETRCITKLLLLFLRASMLRTETRGSHYREDYPKRDDINWMKWIKVTHQADRVRFDYDPVPLEKYKHKVDRFYMDNFILNP